MVFILCTKPIRSNHNEDNRTFQQRFLKTVGPFFTRLDFLNILKNNAFA